MAPLDGADGPVGAALSGSRTGTADRGAVFTLRADALAPDGLPARIRQELIENVQDRDVGLHHGHAHAGIEKLLADRGLEGAETTKHGAARETRGVGLTRGLGGERPQRGHHHGRLTLVHHHRRRSPRGLERLHRVPQFLGRGEPPLRTDGPGESACEHILVLALRTAGNRQKPVETRERVDRLMAQGGVLACPSDAKRLDGRVARDHPGAARFKGRPGAFDRIEGRIGIPLSERGSEGSKSRRGFGEGVAAGTHEGLEFERETVGARERYREGHSRLEAPFEQLDHSGVRGLLGRGHRIFTTRPDWSISYRKPPGTPCSLAWMVKLPRRDGVLGHNGTME